MSESRIINTLGSLRIKQGLSVAGLAAAAGVTRQTIYAIENGTFIPNTAVALRLAQILQTSVETLFHLEPPESETVDVTALSPDEHQDGQPLHLCRVEDKLVALPPVHTPAFLPSHNAIAVGSTRALVLDHTSLDKILIAGCDPALSLLARHAARAGVEVLLTHCNSSEALRLLKAGLVHVAGTHLHEKTNPIPRTLQLVPFASWEQGFITNSLKIKSVTDLTGRGVRFANREDGSGTRVFLDQQLAMLGVETNRVRGYDNVATGHLAAAWQVKTGASNSCIAVRSAALHFGLEFVPLVSERYDFVVHRRALQSAQLQRLFEVVNDGRYRREMKALGGYDLA